MPIPVQQFQAAPSGVAAGLSKMLQGGMAGYGQAQQIKQQKQQMKQAQQQMLMKKMQQQAMQQKMNQQNTLQNQFSQIMGGVDTPESKGTGYLGGQIPEGQMRGQLAKILGASGDYGKATSTLFPRQQDMTALQKNLKTAGYDLKSPEGQDAARTILSGRLLPASTKAARYANEEVKGIIDRVNEGDVIDSVAKFSGVTGMGKLAMDKGLAMFGKTDPDYKKYYTFIHNTVPALASGVRRLLGDNASNEQIKQIEKLSDPSSWTGNKDLVQARWKELMALHNIASGVMSKGPLELTGANQGQDVPRGTQSNQNNQPGQQQSSQQILSNILSNNVNNSQPQPQSTQQYPAEYLDALRKQKEKLASQRGAR